MTLSSLVQMLLFVDVNFFNKCMNFVSQYENSLTVYGNDCSKYGWNSQNSKVLHNYLVTMHQLEPGGQLLMFVGLGGM